MTIEPHASLLKRNTFKINAQARYLGTFRSIDELRQLLLWHKAHCPTLPLLPLGCGSNILFTTPLYNGFVITPSTENNIEKHIHTSDNLVTVWCGVLMDRLIAWTIEHGLYGLENLSWIPGTVGASAVQNIGAYGTEVAAFVKSVHCLNRDTLEERVFSNIDCQYAYRDSVFKRDRQWIVTSVTYRLNRTFTPNINYTGIRKALEGKNITAQTVREAVIDTRRDRLPDPQTEGNAGSFFMNPIVRKEVYERIAAERSDTIPYWNVDNSHVKLSAAWLIEQAGWKGRALGNAAVSDRHALILVNKGNATGDEISALCRTIQATVKDKFGILLQPEVNFL